MSQSKTEQILEQIESNPRYRILEASAGSLITYLLWRVLYPSRIGLPYPVELSLPLELLWGALTGLGPFLGIALAQTVSAVRKSEGVPEHQNWRQLVRSHWGFPFLGLLGGLWAATAWWYLARWMPSASTSLIMTGIWAAVYTLAILFTPLALNRPQRRGTYHTLGLLALLPVLGFIITRWLHVSPDQADLDMTVGLFLRAALVIGTLLVVPTIQVSPSASTPFPAAGEQITILVQTIGRRKKWLNKQGVQLYLGEELAYSSNMIRKLCRGDRRPSAQATLKLLEIGRESGLDQSWGQHLLQATNHFSQTQITDALTETFGPPSKEKER